jgi:hypothetical protein
MHHIPAALLPDFSQKSFSFFGQDDDDRTAVLHAALWKAAAARGPIREDFSAL